MTVTVDAGELARSGDRRLPRSARWTRPPIGSAPWCRRGSAPWCRRGSAPWCRRGSAPWCRRGPTTYADDLGRELREHRHLFLSRQAGPRFRGYLESERRGLVGLRSGGTRNQGRADLRERYGYDVKFAAHMVRLGLQGVELMRTGAITLPIPEPDLTWLRELRRGEHPKEEALARAAELEDEIDRLRSDSPLPEEPDRAALDRFLVDLHRQHWHRHA